jgi:phosphoglycerate dehydrogenase-like enzyme
MNVQEIARVLVSRAVLESRGTELHDAAAGGRPLQLLALEDIAADATQTVHAAFVSRDITGLSTKLVPDTPLRDCYAVLRRSPELQWVHTHSAGADRPIYAELRSRGVAVTTSSGANAKVVAQTALAGLLALARRFPQLMAAQRERRWAPLQAGPAPRDLVGQTAVIVGWGPIARALQPVVTLLGLQVVVVRRGAEAAGPGVETLPFTRLQHALPRADWLVLACPLNAQTHGLIGAAALAALPRGAHLINVARGEVVVQAALVEALRSGHLAGAFLDVFEHEPLPADSPLWTQPGVIVTPHSAGYSDSHAPRVAAIFADNLRRWLAGAPLLHTIP